MRQGIDIAGLSVRRPVLVSVLNLLICIAGLSALFGIEVRELPDVDRPIVTIRTTYEGAAPETVDSEVTRVIEGAAARVSGVRSISSASEETFSRVRIEFEPSVDLADAANDLREAVSQVQRDLPDEVDEVVVLKANDDSEPIIQLAVSSARLPQEILTRLVEEEIIPAFSGVPGVADVRLFGDRERVLRVVVDPVLLASYGIPVEAVANTLRTARFDAPAGSFNAREQNLMVRTDATVTRPGEIENLVIEGSTRIGDVADVFFGPADATSFVRLDGRTVIGLGVVRQAQSNTIAISEGVDEVTARLERTLPDVRISKTSDDAVFVRSAVREVVLSLFFAVLIVVFVIYMFLGSLRAMFIPAVAIPIALIGTLAAVWALGFSLNILTLLGIVLATGIVVDDSIVVLENIQRRRAEGMRNRAAAVLGARQVFFAIIATTATLASVFIPISFLPGSAGRLFSEFGFVLAIAVAISSFVALTLGPMLASRLPADSSEREPMLARLLASVGRGFVGVYRRVLDGALSVPLLTVFGALLVGVFAVGIFHSLDEELLPKEDRGVLQISLRGPEGVGLGYSDRQAAKVERLLEPLVASGEVRSVYTIVGRWDVNRAYVLAPLAPWSERDRSQQEIAADLRPALEAIPGAQISVMSSNSLGIRGGGVELEFALTGTSYEKIAAAGRELVRALEERAPALSDPRMDYSATQPQLQVEIDRQRASDLGIDIDSVGIALRSMVDGYEVADLNVDDNAVPMIINSTYGSVDDAQDLRNLFVPISSGRLVPLSSIVRLEETGISPQLDREGQRRAVEIESGLAQGASLRDAMNAVELVAEGSLPDGIQLLFLDEAATLEETSRGVVITFAVALLVVLLVLAAQFESFASAAIIMVTVPFGVAAAVVALWLTGTSLNIYSQIGLLMVVGLMAKNGILIVEFANQLRDEGRNVYDAARTAALVRLRPVMMTMISTVLGGLPLILSAGAGAEARASIGWVVFGGLGFATLFTLVLTPIAFVAIARFAKPRAAQSRHLEQELAEVERPRPVAVREAAAE